MKTVQFTQEELRAIYGILSQHSYQIGQSTRDKIGMALKGPDNCTVTIEDAQICYTPAKAYESVLNRRERAKIDNEKNVAKRMISELEKINDEAVEIIRDFINSFDIKGASSKKTDVYFRAQDYINNKLF